MIDPSKIQANDLSIKTPLFKAKAEFNEGSQKTNFGKVFAQSLNNLNDINMATANKMEAFSSGQNIEVHEVMLSMEKTGMAMGLAMQVRNKLVDAYHEINRMQL